MPNGFKTILGAIISAATPILALFGIDIGTELGEAFELIVQLVGVILVIVGRVKARGPMTFGK